MSAGYRRERQIPSVKMWIMWNGLVRPVATWAEKEIRFDARKSRASGTEW
jgi:hypothetical protein